ncbi:MAG: M48 family metallopeptidase [Xanthomonadales bacterium]|nr:hypothetical protein [Gammaproteobacteria bacterium]NNL04119.1 M48 family metallopeptidase [Xanthomonadales bacterium]
MERDPKKRQAERRFRDTVEAAYDELYPAANEAMGELLGQFGVVAAQTPLARDLTVRDIGRAAGKCGPGGAVIINCQLIGFPDDIRDTIAHELAHAVIETARRALGSPARRFINRGAARAARSRNGDWAAHGALWKSVARKLGDTGDRCHRLPLQPVRRLRRYLYRSDDGHEVILSSVRHRRLQRDPSLAYRFPQKGVTVLARHFAGEVEEQA